MPKPKRSGPNVHFAVSPWQDKASGTAGAAGDAEAAGGQPGYSVVELPLVVSAAGGGGSGGLAGAASPAGGAAGMAVDSPAAAPVASAAAQPTVGGWVSKKRKPPEAEVPPPPPPPDAAPACPLPVRGAAGAADAEGAEQQAEATVLEGNAYLALLPNGSVTGEAWGWRA